MSMNYREVPSILLPAAFVLLGAVSVCGQAPPAPARAAQDTKTATKSWTVPRTHDGQPDLEGVWDSASMTPLERPAELGNKEFYTPEEIAAYEKKRAQDLNRDRRDGSAEADLGRAYNEAWFDRGAHVASDHRTSRLVEPPNGRFPAMTPAAAKKFKDMHAWLEEHANDGPETRTLPDRCLVFSQSGPPFLPGNYNNYYEIAQSPGTIAILSEMAHQVRTIPLIQGSAGLPPLSLNIRQWAGNSVAHWEGETLVIETANFRASDQSRFGVQYDGMSDENLRVTERLTRSGPRTLTYRATVIDPTVYTQPWTVEFPMERAENQILEYACHEGNYAMSGILSGARVQEKAAARATQR
jgi:hypothetical protein